jgi:hypothetical protein
VLTEARDSVSGWGGRLYFVYLPQWHTYAPKPLPNPDRDRVLQIVGELGLPVIDVYKTFANHEDPLALFPFRIMHHYSEEGYRLVGQDVLRGISAAE